MHSKDLSVKISVCFVAEYAKKLVVELLDPVIAGENAAKFTLFTKMFENSFLIRLSENFCF
jgi:hypothetical protein